jgi:uncharacterized protein (TIGR02231 family)
MMLGLLASTALLSPATAAQITAISHIDAVTVYPRGAEITRSASVDLTSGEHTLTLDNLPGAIDPQSIRVEGVSDAAVRIGSVDSKVVHVSDNEAFSIERKRLEGELQTRRDELAAIDRLNRNIEYQRRLIQDLAQRPFNVQTKEDSLQVDSSEMGNLFDLVASRLQALDERAQTASIRGRVVSEEIRELEVKLAELAPRRTAKTVVTVHIASPSAASGEFRVRYRIHNAGWRPFYDARLNVAEAGEKQSLSLVRRAEIVQNTTESWDNVRLSLSTARPVGATSMPEINSTLLALWDEHRMRNKKAENYLGKLDTLTAMSEDSRQGLADAAGEEKEQDAPQAAEPQHADVNVSGLQATYAIPGRVSIDNEGTAKKVEISEQTVTASLSVLTAPVLDSNAYLTANFKLDGDETLLPGRVLLFRDNVYMGEGTVPLLSPGEEHALGFGVDDRVKVKRTQVRRETSVAGLISEDRVQESSWLIEVENHHGTAMPITIFDRVPQSTHEDIDVDLLAGTTKIDQRDVDDKPGVMAWQRTLGQGETARITFGYRIATPKNQRVRIGMN